MNFQTSLPRFKSILVPLDGSPMAEEALVLATHLVRASNAELLLLRVVPPSSCVPLSPLTPIDLTESMREAAFSCAQTYLEQVTTYEHLDNLKVQTEVLLGGAANTIIDYALQQGVDLIVMRSHGETGLSRWIMGSTAQQLVRNCPLPVLVINKPQNQPIDRLHVSHVLIALDGSPLAEEAIRPAALLSAALAHPGKGTIHLTRVVQNVEPDKHQTKEQREQINKERQEEAMGYLQHIKQRVLTGALAPLNLAMTTSVVTYTNVEDITRCIIEESTCIGGTTGSTGSDIIAMSTHGRHGFQHLLLGSFTEEVFDAARKPLLVVHTTKSKQKTQTRNRKPVDVPII
ncbi:universal stress protein [Dictyobacter arantiisoli]|uniref:Universal stress protein UspA n=1 Tax=Dictyobacter arantiisoli TaxID=2014874 RepID=A0A5A5TBB3_9CHLR|nr:universal stress protein [Dictyobacter arantiisoli]GCF08688.1 universal stress protein UspA [Dictyobacter arantiisoli]